MSFAYDQVAREKLIANVRGVPEHLLLPTCVALIEGGVRCLELTLDTKGALQTIEQIRRQYDDVLVGAGTVMDAPMAQEAIARGAHFLITPHVNLQIAHLQQVLPIWMGAMTPTEIVQAAQVGCELVKVYPSGVLGASYLSTVREPLRHIPMIASGGVRLEQIQDFFTAGAIAVSVAGDLVDKEKIAQKKFPDIEQKARTYVTEVQKSKQKK